MLVVERWKQMTFTVVAAGPTLAAGGLYCGRRWSNVGSIAVFTTVADRSNVSWIELEERQRRWAEEKRLHVQVSGTRRWRSNIDFIDRRRT